MTDNQLRAMRDPLFVAQLTNLSLPQAQNFLMQHYLSK